MAESVYKVIELIGTSKESWEKAATANELSVGYNTVKTGKPPHTLTWDEIDDDLVLPAWKPASSRQNSPNRPWSPKARSGSSPSWSRLLG